MLEKHHNFQYRHVGPTLDQQKEMLDFVGASSLTDLMAKALPEAIQYQGGSTLPEPISEDEALARLHEIAAKNRITQSFIGQGYFGTRTPGVIKRNVLENPSWYTAYTPYQPEISQGRLEALINFQTVVTDLTGMKTANASMLDESTAVVEAMMVAKRSADSQSNTFFADNDLYPQTKQLLEHRAEPLGITVRYFDPANLSELDEECFGAVVQYPGGSGRIVDMTNLFAKVHEFGGLAIATADLMALTLLKPPGEMGADVVCGTTQRFGVPMGFGGPHAGYLAVREKLERTMPGRLVGVSVDAEGAPAYRLTLQTREQHIRREKATSNICTAQVLLAVMAGMYAVYHGPQNLKAIASEIHAKTTALATVLKESGFTLQHENYFDTIRVINTDAQKYFSEARKHNLTMFKVDSSTLGISVDESTTWQHLADLAASFGARAPKPSDAKLKLVNLRTSGYLEHPVFNSYHSETAMLRYLKKLADFDYALDRGMIPLGSCTMKLNSVTEMEAVTWPEFANLHPFAPAEDTQGYLELINELTSWLSDITGYEAVSLQPNAGSQGELAGLLAIRGYHRSRGDFGRNVCLIPSSAHGTNAASAVLAGMEVVVVACDDNGNVDVDDLKTKIAETADKLSALMITYPSTHGVYEEAVVEICDLVHAAGGQVYIDGANTNAVVGFAKFGEFGGDVSHLNLHKTFCIPHGGGGPGVGPVVARTHLAKFLPGHSMAQQELTGYGPVSAAPFGSPSILPISWAYIQMMGSEGLRVATSVAVLSANYVAKKLSDAFPLLYTGKHGLVAHEAIIDIRPLQRDAGIGNDDIAKRLVDYGFHAPTMSFPVAGTLMIEPTESEPKEELDRFIDAMLAIRAEAAKVESGEWPREDNPLVNAPHTANHLVSEWNHPYSREEAVFPTDSQRKSKYWPPVRRIDGAFGDRNLTCTCPPIESFAKG
ncbi:aminomethyl-transferring glycine dehydrogenase [Aquiluna sp. KACHI24]|uniref:aminomethyl-transferring glycine dehydrogenase n=1 Tax=Aquiluna sp. KACHI24 TaxID=2968831 RepID=UPI00220EDD2F|nr:aminomethyl-transferring glycine dehydrogenase [Aquiluna sp. KACHI24]BDQ00926.1 glycine dehydrogenase (decarboxylating) [Aquiluna sp. KACHI24]